LWLTWVAVALAATRRCAGAATRETARRAPAGPRPGDGGLDLTAGNP